LSLILLLFFAIPPASTQSLNINSRGLAPFGFDFGHMSYGYAGLMGSFLGYDPRTTEIQGYSSFGLEVLIPLEEWLYLRQGVEYAWEEISLTRYNEEINYELALGILLALDRAQQITLGLRGMGEYFHPYLIETDLRRGTRRSSGVYAASTLGLELGYSNAWLSPLVWGARIEVDSPLQDPYGKSAFSGGPWLRPPTYSLTLAYQLADSDLHLGRTIDAIRAPNNRSGDSRRSLRYLGPTVSLVMPALGQSSSPGYLSRDQWAFLPGFEAYLSFDWWYLSLKFFDLKLDQFNNDLDQWELNSAEGFDLGLGLHLSLMDHVSLSLGGYLTVGRSSAEDPKYDREGFPGAGSRGALNLRLGNNLVWTFHAGLGSRLPWGEWVSEYGTGLAWAF
jgi:hypothetical protein